MRAQWVSSLNLIYLTGVTDTTACRRAFQGLLSLGFCVHFAGLLCQILLPADQNVINSKFFHHALSCEVIVHICHRMLAFPAVPSCQWPWHPAAAGLTRTVWRLQGGGGRAGSAGHGRQGPVHPVQAARRAGGRRALHLSRLRREAKVLHPVRPELLSGGLRADGPARYCRCSVEGLAAAGRLSGSGRRHC